VPHRADGDVIVRITLPLDSHEVGWVLAFAARQIGIGVIDY
jgi:hypothetical protein